MKTLSTSIKWLFRLGTEGACDFEQAKKTEFINQVSVLYFCIGLFYALLFLCLNFYVLAAILFLATSGYVGCLYLNAKKKYNSTRFMVILNTTLPIYFASAITGKDVMGHVFLIFLFTFSVMEFSILKNIIKALLIPLSAYILLEVTHYQFFYQVELSQPLTKFLSITVFVMTSIILCLMVIFYKNLVTHMRRNAAQLFNLYPLTERELEVIAEITKGHSNKQIADYLFIEESTVKTHLKNIYRKLNVSNRAEIFALLVKS